MKQHAMHCPIKGIPETTPADYEAIEPLLEYLRSNQRADAPLVFPRGTVLPDGRLDLCKQNIGPGGCRAITQALISNETVSALLLGTDGIGDTGASDIARLIEGNTQLEIVYLGCNLIGARGISDIAQALTTNTTVTGLWLKRNPIGNAGADALAEMLRHNRTLTTLDLVNTFLGKDGLAAILDVLIHENRTIKRVYLGGNEIDANDADKLGTLIESNSIIHALHLNVNDLGDAGAQRLAIALASNASLRQLDLASNGITTLGAIPLIHAIGQHPTLSIMGLGYSRSTTVLGAKANVFDEACYQLLGKILTMNSRLTRIDLRGSRLSGKSLESLKIGLNANTTLLELLIDPPDAQILERLESNRKRQGFVGLQAPRDVRLIQSVYRTA